MSEGGGTSGRGASEVARRAVDTAGEFVREEAKSAIPAARRAATHAEKVFERNSGGSIVGGR
ncbi:MAG: hypothetical protein H0U65_17405 [Rubrobacter sp.]|nr:hypothetical protein [Rubrobacter sp.]